MPAPAPLKVATRAGRVSLSRNQPIEARSDGTDATGTRLATFREIVLCRSLPQRDGKATGFMELALFATIMN